MNKKEFFIQFKELCDYYKNNSYKNEKIIKLYYNQLKNMNIDDFKNECEKIMCKSKFMPKVADFISSSGYKGRQYTKEYLDQFYDN